MNFESMDSKLNFGSYEPNIGTAPNLGGQEHYRIFGGNKLVFDGI